MLGFTSFTTSLRLSPGLRQSPRPVMSIANPSNSIA